MFDKILNYVFVFLVTLSSASYAGTGAGILPLFDDGTVLLGKELRGRPGQAPRYVWSDFGGRQDRGETLPQTALREFKEETAHYTFPKVSINQVINAPYVDHIHRVGSYRMYFVPLHGAKPSIADIVKNAKKAKQKLGHKAHVEKAEWKYVNAQQFLNAVKANAPLPGTNEEIYGPAKACIKKPVAQITLQNCAVAKRAVVVPPKVVTKAAKPSRTVKPYKKAKSSKKAKVQKKIKSVKKVRAPKVMLKTKKRPAMKRGKPFKRMKTPKKVNVKKRTHKKRRK